jgi:hypothetical protein
MPPQNSDPQRNKKIEEYFSYLDKAFAHEVDWSRAIEVKKELLPKRLFKYQRFDQSKSVAPCDSNEDYCLQNLRKQEFRFTAPHDFNDPYDTVSFFVTAQAVEKAPYDLEAFLSLPDIRDHMKEELKESLRSSDRKRETVERILLQQVPDELSRTILMQVKTEVHRQAADDIVRRMNQFFRQTVRVSSFCEINDSIVMWSHYGGYHRGFCLEYDSARLALSLDIPGWLHPVRYNANLFDITKYLQASIQYQTTGGPISNSWAMIMACHKSPEWGYEREWRTVALDERDFFPVGPVSVILGARIDDLPDQKAALVAIATELRIPIKQAVLCPNRFELTVVGDQSDQSRRRLKPAYLHSAAIRSSVPLTNLHDDSISPAGAS